MLDIQYIRDNPKEVAQSALDKGIDVDVEQLLKLDESRRTLIAQAEKLRAERNEIAGSMKGGKPSSEQIEKGREVKEKLAAVEEELDTVSGDYEANLKSVPNTYSKDTPKGASEDENQVVYEWGDKRDFKTEGFTPKNHWELAEAHGWIDKERAAKVTGARFAYISGPLVNLQFAIELYVVNILSSEEGVTEIIKSMEVEVNSTKPFTPVLPPHMVRTDVFEAMDRLDPREDRYKIEDEDLWLQGSAEHVLGPRHLDEIIPEADLPIRYLGYATSYRREAGTYGKDMEGIIRMHQFDKLEMEIISAPDQGMNEHMLTIAVQEYLMRQLDIPYRKLLKCTADIGKPNFRGVDLDAWLPGQDSYRETHTADYMTDYQARRLKTRVKLADGSIAYVHTIDATAFALGRILVAIIENNQTEDGRVRIPEVLKPFLNGKEQI